MFIENFSIQELNQILSLENISTSDAYINLNRNKICLRNSWSSSIITDLSDEYILSNCSLETKIYFIKTAFNNNGEEFICYLNKLYKIDLKELLNIIQPTKSCCISTFKEAMKIKGICDFDIPFRCTDKNTKEYTFHKVKVKNNQIVLYEISINGWTIFKHSRAKLFEIFFSDSFDIDVIDSSLDAIDIYKMLK